MFNRIKVSWSLLERSLQVMAREKKLLVFPLVTFASTIFIAFFFLGAFLLQPTGHGLKEKAHWVAVGHSIFTKESLDQSLQTPSEGRKKSELEFNRVGMAVVAGLYFFFLFLGTFFNVAFYHEIIEALGGRRVGIWRGLSFAKSRWKAIFMWSLFAGVVGYCIRALERRVGFIGKLVIGLIGLAWSVAAIFAIPVIICNENITNPVTVLKNSAQTLKKSWGETLIGFVSLHGGSVLIILGSSALFVAGLILTSMLPSSTATFGLIVAWVLFIFSLSYLTGVAGNVFQCALYLYASTGTIPAGYTKEMMDLAWRHKKK